MSADADLVFYDGTCGLCHGFVRFLLARDRDGTRFRYAPLEGSTFSTLVPPDRRAGLPDSIVVRTSGGGLRLRSAAVLEALRRLPPPWPLAAAALAVVPPPVRDWGYDRVAAVRRRLFARPAEACPLVPPGLRDRFLD